ncbi:MAG: two-component regulator propeller domain-containing protein [Adhaeribacter sp.]
MPLKFLPVFLSLLIFGMGARAQEAGNSFYTEVSEEKWLPNYAILRIFQDSKGYIWVGTNAGLFKYDGLTTTNYAFTQSDNHTLLNNTIRDIAEDRLGNIWVATGSGLASLQTSPVRKKLVLAENIENLKLGLDGMLWASTNDSPNLLYQINPAAPGQAKPEALLNGRHPAARQVGSPIKSIWQAGNGHLWLGSARGLFLLHTKTRQVYPTDFTLPVNTIYGDAGGLLWIGTESDGVFAGKPRVKGPQVQFNQVRHYHLGESREASFDKIRVLTALPGRYLIASTFNHLYLSDLSRSPANTFFQPAKTSRIFQDSNVLSVLADRQQNIWVGTLHGLYKLKSQQFSFRQIKLATPDYIPINNQINKLSADRQGNLWAVSNNDGLFRYDPESKKVYRIRPPGEGKVKILEQAADNSYLVYIGSELFTYPAAIDQRLDRRLLQPLARGIDDIQVVLEESPGTWWLGTWNNGLIRVGASRQPLPADPFFTSLAKAVGKGTHISCMVQDPKGGIWIGHRGRGLIRANRKTKEIKVFHAGQKGLLSDRILSVYPDRKGRVWIATRGHGVQVYDEGKDHFQSFTTSHGLPSNTVCGFGEDENGILWVSTQHGLARYLPGQLVPFVEYGKQDGIVHTEFTFNTVINDPQKRLYFGNSDGIYQVQANKNSYPASKPAPLVITDLNLLAAREQNARQEEAYEVQIRKNRQVHLPYAHNSFSLSFSSLDFTAPEKIKYAYRLVGYEKAWTFTTAANRTVQYLDIPAGTYTFQVKCSDSAGAWHQAPVGFTLRVAPPFWLSPPAYVFYLVLFLALAGTALFFLRRWFSLQRQLKQEAAALQLQNQQMVYFSDLSHEIKNRLSLILGPLETALSGKKVNKAILHNLYEQAQRLKRINEQIISIRKSEAGEFLLNVAEADISQFIAEVCERVRPLALVRNIRLSYEPAPDLGGAWFDKELLEIILLNLLTNAIKYSGADARVVVTTACLSFSGQEVKNGKPGRYVCCSVEDTGAGTPGENLSQVKAAFYRAPNVEPRQEGAGPGLNLVHRLVGRHHGWMQTGSQEQAFTPIRFYLPVEKQHYALNEMQPSVSLTPILEASLASEQGKTAVRCTTPPLQEHKARILVVDEDAGLRQSLRQSLEADFLLEEAANGEEAFQQLLAGPFSLVLSELSLPLMDGLTLLKKIKQDPDLRDIPVIILTGKSLESEKLLCLELQADDFMEKPCSPELLKGRIRNLMDNRQVLREKFSRKISLAQPAHQQVLGPDDKFIQEVAELIGKNLANENLSVDYLAEHLCISRATLYRKMEDLLGESPSDFIKKSRLKKAASLLQEGKFYVSQVAYMVGAKNPKQFAKSFQKEYGISPSDYMKLPHQAQKTEKDRQAAQVRQNAP